MDDRSGRKYRGAAPMVLALGMLVSPHAAARSSDPGYHALVGVDYHVTQKNVIGVEFRHLWLDANFDDIGLGKVKAGGSLLWLGYRRYF